MFLQVAVPRDDSLCLRCPRIKCSEQSIEVYEYTRHVFGVKTLPTRANYALHQLAKANTVIDKCLGRTVQRTFYLDDFPNPVRTLQEAIEIHQKVKDIFSQGGFKLTKLITRGKTRFWGKNLAALCKLRLAPIGEG